MQSIKTLLFISHKPEKEQHLFNWTLNLAKQHQAQVLVLTVLPELKASLVDWAKNRLPVDLQNSLIQKAREQLHPWGLKANQLGVNLNIQVEFGKVFYKAIQFALKKQPGLVIKQIDAEADELSILLGSQDQHLLRKCPFPLFLYKANSRLPFTNLMVSLDVDIEAESLQRDATNTKMLAWLDTLIHHDHPANIHIAHAWQAEAENLVRYWNSELSELDILHFTETMRQQHAAALEYEIHALRQNYPNLHIHLAKGRAEQVIPNLTTEHNIDLLVMGTVGRTGLTGLVIGNTAETIIDKIECSILAVKPDEFVSPISG